MKKKAKKLLNMDKNDPPVLSPEMERWIKEQLAAGFTPDELKEALRRAGRDPSLVDQYLARQLPPPPTPTLPPSPPPVSIRPKGLAEIPPGTTDFYILGAKAGALAGAADGIAGAIISTVISAIVVPLILPQIGIPLGGMLAGPVGALIGSTLGVAVAGKVVGGLLAPFAIASSIISGIIWGALLGAILGAVIAFLWNWSFFANKTLFLRALIVRGGIWVLWTLILFAQISAVAAFIPFAQAVVLTVLPGLVGGIVGVFIYAKLFERFVKAPPF